MATLTTLWPFLMASWCSCFKDPPRSPFPLVCHIPCDDNSCSADIICSWNTLLGPDNNLSYTLHWEGTESKGADHRTIIQRHHFTSDSELRVWVQTKDRDGNVSKSETVTFNTAEIIKPSPPNIIASSPEPMEIHWTTPCDQIMLGVGHCEVRHRPEEQQAWFQQEEGGVSGSYTLFNPEPCTPYFFQARCACGTSMMSEWSEAHIIRSAQRAPIGTLDIWRDCGIIPQSFNCVLAWKTLPRSKACGNILGYNLRLYVDNGTDVGINVSVETSVNLVCDEPQCYYYSSLRNVRSVRVNTYNALGGTPYSHLSMKISDKIPKTEALYLEMSENNLIVTWKTPSGNPGIKDYVVQYKEAGASVGKGFDWIRANSTLTKVAIKGQFKKFTAYQVSVFTVLDHNDVQLYCTNVTHFVQGSPAKVPIFKVFSCETTQVRLLWQTVLMSVQNGITPFYLIGHAGSVHNISAYPQLENRTFILDNLKEDHHYEVWIRAVNQAGPGPKSTVLFKTLSTKNMSNEGATTIYILEVLGGCLGSTVILCVLLCCRNYYKVCPACLSEKVPDPHNSNIILKWNPQDQIFDSMVWLCNSSDDQCPEISKIEIVQTWPSTVVPLTDKITYCEDGDNALEDVLMAQQNKTHCGCGKREYSKMVDSDEEKCKEDETSNNSWSTEEDRAGYEQHFMPTNIDLQEIVEQEKTETSCGEESSSFDVLCVL